VLVNERDLASRGLKHGDVVDISVVSDAGANPGERVMRNLTAVAYNIAGGSIAAYYPQRRMSWSRSIIATQNLERRSTSRLRCCSALVKP
jgi:anaerobic selenocysteine-containing dehydrogenase